MTDDLLAHNGHLAQVLGLHVGHFTHPGSPHRLQRGAVPARGHRRGRCARRSTRHARDRFAPPSHLVQHVHGITLAGGSAWGLDAASGTVRWLEEHGAGLDIGVGRLPLVPAAVLFDLTVGDMRIRPMLRPGMPPAKRPASRPAMSARPKAAWARGPGRWWAKFLVLTAPRKAALARPASPCMGSPWGP